MRRSLQVFPILAVSWLWACAPEGPSAFVTYNIPPDQTCVVSPSAGANLFLPFGEFDISRGTADSCAKSYVVNLLVNSYLRPSADVPIGRAEPNILMLHSAKVKLMTLQREVFDFKSADQPNPFLTTTNNSLFPSTGNTPSTGIASVEVIPVDYADKLADRVGGQILAEVQIYGTTTGDVDIDFKPFVYPIKICDGCLTRCFSELIDLGLTEDDVVGDDCPDNAGADGRVCIDPGC